MLEVVADREDPPRIFKLAVQRMPGSAAPAEQLAAAGIDAGRIVNTARRLLSLAPV